MKRILLVVSTVLSLQATAQTTPASTPTATDRTFQLGEVEIVGIRDQDSTQRVSATTIQKFNRNDVSNALNLLPGISLANVGPRNESVVYVRGFDLRQVPVFIDGVPVYVPYDGYVDMGRFTTFDLAEVNVAKGFSSILYGANTMGGAINLVSRKPVKKLDLNGSAGIFSGDGYRWHVNAGSRFEKFYVQLGASQLKQDFYPLSDNFTYRKNQYNDERQNAYRDDRKLSAKVGFTPNATDEYAIGYVNQQGEKGTPPYIGTDPTIRARFWQWPKWDKQSLYFISNTAVGEKNTIKTRLYYDTFVNELFSYDDTTYTTITPAKRAYAFKSYYDDYTIGGHAELASRVFDAHILKLAIQAKRDVHREHNEGEPERTFIDNTASIGLEDTYQLTEAIAIIPGVSLNTRKSDQAEDYNATTQAITDFPSNDNTAVNAQVGVSWRIHPRHTLFGAVARKTRFATIKDRYSYRMGTAIPNPDLAAEVAVNYDLRYTGKLTSTLDIQAAVFRSDITDIIQQVDNVEPGRFQLQNAGDALFYGVETGAQWAALKGLNLSAHYTYMRRKNETLPTIRFTNVPNHKTFGAVDYTFLQRFNLLASIEYNSKRYSTSYGTKASGYTLVNAKASAKVYKYVSIEGGVNNIFDRDYSLVEGFPEAGRNFMLTLVFSNL